MAEYVTVSFIIHFYHCRPPVSTTETDEDYKDAQSNRDPEEDIASQATAGVNDADDQDHDNDT